MSFKNPSFQERASASASARVKALEQLRAKPPVDEAALAERAAKRAAREAAEAEKRNAARLAREELAEAKRAAKLEAELAKKAAVVQAPVLTEAERKAARDARYAARKNRKK